MTLQCVEIGGCASSRRIIHYNRSEIRKLATVDVGALRQQTDRLAQQFRALDTAIKGRTEQPICVHNTIGLSIR